MRRRLLAGTDVKGHSGLQQFSFLSNLTRSVILPYESSVRILRARERQSTSFRMTIARRTSTPATAARAGLHA